MTFAFTGENESSNEGMETEQKKEKIKQIFRYPVRIAQTPRAGTGDSVGRFRRCRCSTQFNYNCNLWYFHAKIAPATDNCGLLPTPKETYALNLNAVTLRISTFRIPTSIFVPKNYTILVCFSNERFSKANSNLYQVHLDLYSRSLFNKAPPGRSTKSIQV